MDIFKLLARGASIKQKQKQDLSLFNGQQQASSSAADIDRRVNFFAAPKKPSASSNSNNEDDVDAAAAPAELRIKTAEQAAENRARQRIRVTGDAPLPIGSFDDLVSRYELAPKLRRNLASLSFEVPTAIQSEAIPILLEEHDLLACAPTGSGKTLAFVAPIVQALATARPAAAGKRGPRALIVSPTRELAQQIYEVAVQLGQGMNVAAAILNKKQLAKLRNSAPGDNKNIDLVVSTPMRLIEGQKEGLFDLASVQWLILDEADRLLGDGFVQQTDEIIAQCTNNHIVKAIFSATMPLPVEDLARSVMTAQPCRVFVGHKEGAAESVAQELLYCGSEAGKLTAIRQMLAGGDVVPPILVFVQSIQRAKALFHELLYDKVNVDAIHSEMSQTQRDRVVSQFKQGDIWVLICTDVLSRGIDFHGVNLVINYDVPLNAQSYVHRIGRTGRAGRQGKAITFYSNQDTEVMRPIVNVMRQSGCQVSDWLIAATTSRKHRKRVKPASRADISTVPKVDKRKRQQRQQMIEASKRRSKSSTTE